MKISTALEIFQSIESGSYTDSDKGEAISIVLAMPTHNSVSKVDMLQVIGYLFPLCFDLPRDKLESEADTHAR